MARYEYSAATEATEIPSRTNEMPTMVLPVVSCGLRYGLRIDIRIATTISWPANTTKAPTNAKIYA